MKFSFGLIASACLLIAPMSFATGKSTLYIKDGKNLIDVQELVDSDNAVSEDEVFCYKGTASTVVKKMTAWSKKTDYFFSGTGGGFVLADVKINRGIVSYDIVMTLEDEVVPGEFKSILIKPCR